MSSGCRVVRKPLNRATIVGRQSIAGRAPLSRSGAITQQMQLRSVAAVSVGADGPGPKVRLVQTNIKQLVANNAKK